MASVSMSEKDFRSVADAAQAAEKSGEIQRAIELDRIARKISAALTRAQSQDERFIARSISGKAGRMSWRDVPTLLSTEHMEVRDQKAEVGD